MRLSPRHKKENLFPDTWESFWDSHLLSDDLPYPQIDVEDKDAHYLFEVELPGFSKKDLTVTYVNGYLDIRGERELETNVNHKQYIRKERTYGSFRRNFYIGEIDQKNIKSSFMQGLLTINVPKPAEDHADKNDHIIPIDE